MEYPDKKDKSEENGTTQGTLYIVSTSIGNDDDVTLRAIKVLQKCDLVLCEDIKVGAKILRRLNISKKLEMLNEQNESDMSGEYIKLMSEGMSISLISDAGTPVFEDPGLKLVQQALKLDIPVVVVPGVTSIMTALVRSGFSIKQFLYAGLLSRLKDERFAQLRRLADESRTVVILETPYRLLPILEAASQVMPNRKAYIGINLTMPFETHHYGTFDELHKKFKEERFKGEFVICFEGMSFKDKDNLPEKIERSDTYERRDSYRGRESSDRGGRYERGDRSGSRDRDDRPRYERRERSDRDDRPRYNRNERSDSYDRKPRFDREKRSGSDDRPRYDRREGSGFDDRKPRFDREKSNSSEDRPRYERRERSSGDDKPRFERRERSSSDDRKLRFDREKRTGDDKPRYERRERSGGDDKPRYERKERTSRDDSKPRYERRERSGGDDKPRFDREKRTGGDDKPRYERRERSDRPSGGDSRGERRVGSGSDDKPKRAYNKGSKGDSPRKKPSGIKRGRK